jgi:hypothetical protein
MIVRELLGAVAVASVLLAATPTQASLGALSALELSVLEQADALLEIGEWQRACGLLESRFGASPDNLEILGRLGECRTGLGQYGRAMADYRRILAEVDAPIILARLMLLETAASHGLIEVQDVPATMPPLMLTGQATLGVLIDSNANAGTSATSVEAMLGIFPLLLSVSESSRGQPDNALTLGLSGSYLQPLNAHFALAARAEASASLYTLEENSRQAVRFASGVIFVDGPFAANLMGNLGVTWRGGEIDQLTAGIGARGNVELLSGLTLGLGGSVGRTDFPLASLRNAILRDATMGLQYVLVPGLSASLDYVVGRSDANDALHSHDLHGPRVGASIALGPQLDLGVSYAYEMARYDRTLAIFPQGREDRTHAVAATLTVDLSDAIASGASASVGYSYRHTDSTIDIHDSERHAISAAVRYDF